MVDDAHGLGVIGATGRGTIEHTGTAPAAVPILIGTLGKAFGTFGAFVAGDTALIEYIIQRARTYIYTTRIAAGRGCGKPRRAAPGTTGKLAARAAAYPDAAISCGGERAWRTARAIEHADPTAAGRRGRMGAGTERGADERRLLGRGHPAADGAAGWKPRGCASRCQPRIASRTWTRWLIPWRTCGASAVPLEWRALQREQPRRGRWRCDAHRAAARLGHEPARVRRAARRAGGGTSGDGS